MSNKNQNIILIGFMGSGKTTIGSLLAKRLHYQFQDTDEMIESSVGNTIRQIFDFQGEEYFRDLETNVLIALKNQMQDTVLSTGGGLILRETNRKLLNELGFIIYLKASKETLVQRLLGDTTRPLLRGEELEDKVSRLLDSRASIYEETAHEIIDTDELSREEIVDLIVKAYLSDE
ncbi:MAG TPA: shikimate kinase [Clostridiales bacterium]|jgi:shikimate kinase|nr:shikimate kinase [Clostridiales bacterium]